MASDLDIALQASKTASVNDTAVGSYESACLMGVHFTRPASMARKGLLKTRLVRSQSDQAETAREVAVYSLRGCEEDWRDYERRLAAGTARRRRAYADERPAMQRKLAKLKVQIDFHDAVGSVEAAEILGVTIPWAVRMARNKEVVGRLLLSERAAAARRWIFSRRSCEEAASVTRRLAATGKKIGRPRSRMKRH
jgi:hypothetical protein